MAETQPTRRVASVGGMLIAGTLCAAAFCYLRPFDLYLLNRWESELATISDEEVVVHLEQIAALGERSLPTLVAALHNDRRIVAEAAAAVLLRELGELELRSTEESSRVVADLARELAARGNHPGPHSGSSSHRLATRLLLWPIDRKSIDGERLVANCESIIRSARRSPRDAMTEPAVEKVDAQDGLVSRSDELGRDQRMTPVASGGLTPQLMDAPLLPPQETRVFAVSPAVPPTEPANFLPAQASRAMDEVPLLAADGTATPQSTTPQSTKPRAADPRPGFELRRDDASEPGVAPTHSDLRAMADLDVMRKLAEADDTLARAAVEELHRRGFQTKHLRLAELLVDPEPNVRLQLVERLPQMSGIDSRPWLLWLSRDREPAVRKAAVAVIATSADPTLQERLRELEREETDDGVLRVVRQYSNARQTNTLR